MFIASMMGPSVGVYADFDRGYHYALQRKLGKVNAAAKRGASGYADYGRLLTRLLRKAEGSVYVPYPRNRYPKNPDDLTGKRLRKVYDEEDPFPPRNRRPQQTSIKSRQFNDLAGLALVVSS